MTYFTLFCSFLRGTQYLVKITTPTSVCWWCLGLPPRHPHPSPLQVLLLLLQVFLDGGCGPKWFLVCLAFCILADTILVYVLLNCCRSFQCVTNPSIFFWWWAFNHAFCMVIACQSSFLIRMGHQVLHIDAVVVLTYNLKLYIDT